MANPPDGRAAPATLRHAATVILLREVPDTVEVLVVRRHENLAFMGGMWVFPGGTLSPADMSAAALSRIPAAAMARCAQLRDLNGAPLDQQHCLGISVAAHRETFEETGVLLATTADGHHCRDDLLQRLQEQRRAIVAQPELFTALLQQEDLLLDVGRLTYWAHWITPSNAPRRFDTRFFLAVQPARQTANIDSVETIDHAWRSPAALLDAAGGGTMPISPPTLYNLITLAASLRLHGSLAALLAAQSQREIVPVLPKLIRGQATTMVLPWDQYYPNAPGESAPHHIAYPQWLRDLPSRMTVR